MGSSSESSKNLTDLCHSSVEYYGDTCSFVRSLSQSQCGLSTVWHGKGSLWSFAWDYQTRRRICSAQLCWSDYRQFHSSIDSVRYYSFRVVACCWFLYHALIPLCASFLTERRNCFQRELWSTIRRRIWDGSIRKKSMIHGSWQNAEENKEIIEMG